VTVAYFDASALVKLFVEEDGTNDATALWDGADALLTSRITEAEVPAAFAAARRAHRLDTGAHLTAKRRWGQYRGALQMVELTAELTLIAGDMAEQYALGGLDAIHLASASQLTDVTMIMATWDVRLLTAARSAGIATLPAR
jgi:predicted nucleic acid-binding protein